MEKFGQYILLEKVASGGMAELFKAKKIGIEGFERVLAIKRILPHISSDEEFIDMFIAEAKLVARLSHKNIAQIYDFGKFDDTVQKRFNLRICHVIQIPMGGLIGFWSLVVDPNLILFRVFWVWGCFQFSRNV